jgi:hypothetical protein
MVTQLMQTRPAARAAGPGDRYDGPPMARSWHYPRWRRIVMQVVLWAVFGATLGLAALVARHKRQAGTLELQAARTVALPVGGPTVGVRLPKGWMVLHDPAEHDDDDEDDANGPSVWFVAREADGGPDPIDPDDGPRGQGRELRVRCRVLRQATTAAAYLDQSGLLRGTVELPAEDNGPAADGGALPVAGSQGVWRSIRRMVGAGPGQPRTYLPEYVAVGVVPVPAAKGATATVGVTVQLDCPDGDVDPEGDRDLIRRVAAAIMVAPLGR